MYQSTRIIFVTDDKGTHRHSRVLGNDQTETLTMFLSRVYPAQKIIVSVEKYRPGEFCKPYTVYTKGYSIYA